VVAGIRRRHAHCTADAFSATCAQETTPMSSTPALVLVGLVLVLLSIPLAFSLGPIVLGGFLLVLGYRRATAALEAPAAATPA